MKKEWLLTAVSSVITIVLALAAIRWFAPQLLGLPTDLQMVRVDKKVPPFFDGVFRQADLVSHDFLIVDPILLRRAKPLLIDDGSGMGPHDLLGFRNRHIPDVADVVAIGDSQTYGNNALLEWNWPSQLRKNLAGAPEVYGMAVGAWGAVQYLEIFSKALYLRPHVVIVAFYTGNDPLDSFIAAYGDARWRELRPDPKLTAADAPSVVFPAPKDEWWPVSFPDGVHTAFTAKLRDASNRDTPVVRAGYGIMARAATEMGKLAQITGVHLILTIIPTKEFVYAEKVRRAGIASPPDYSALVADETRNIKALAEQLRAVPGAEYVDVADPLQQAALQAVPLYPEDDNGHPVNNGYAVIAAALTASVAKALPPAPNGFVTVQVGPDSYQPRLVQNGHQWMFGDMATLQHAGWKPDVRYPLVTPRDLMNIPYGDYSSTPVANQTDSAAASGSH